MFENIPLSTIEVLFSSQADGANDTGATVADSDCVDGDGNPISPDAGSDEDVDETDSDLEPNDAGKEYTCTIFVDP